MQNSTNSQNTSEDLSWDNATFKHTLTNLIAVTSWGIGRSKQTRTADSPLFPFYGFSYKTRSQANI